MSFFKLAQRIKNDASMCWACVAGGGHAQRNSNSLLSYRSQIFRIFVISACLFISGCSVTPLYTDSETSSSMPIIRMIPGRQGQILHAELCRLFKTFPHKLGGHTIRINLQREQTPTAYDIHGIANRLNVEYIADVRLVNQDKHDIVLQEKISVVQGNRIYGSAGEIISSLYSDYEKSQLKLLAEKIFKKLTER